MLLASGGVFAVSGLGHGASWAVGRGWICGRAGPLGLMVERRHEAWQGVSVSNLGLLAFTLSGVKGLAGAGAVLRSECQIAESRTKRQFKSPGLLETCIRMNYAVS